MVFVKLALDLSCDVDLDYRCVCVWDPLIYSEVGEDG